MINFLLKWIINFSSTIQKIRCMQITARLSALYGTRHQHQKCKQKYNISHNSTIHVHRVQKLVSPRAGLRHWGSHAKGSWGPSPSLLSPSLSGPSLSASFQLPPVPSSALSLPQGSNYFAEFIFPDFSLSFPDKMNNFP